MISKGNQADEMTYENIEKLVDDAIEDFAGDLDAADRCLARVIAMALIAPDECRCRDGKLPAGDCLIHMRPEPRDAHDATLRMLIAWRGPRSCEATGAAIALSGIAAANNFQGDQG